MVIVTQGLNANAYQAYTERMVAPDAEIWKRSLTFIRNKEGVKIQKAYS